MNINWNKYLVAIVIAFMFITDGLSATADNDDLFFRGQGEALMRLVGFTPRTNDVGAVNRTCYKWVNMVDIDGTNIVIGCEHPDQEFVFWKGEDSGRRIMLGTGAIRAGASPRDVAISVFTDRVRVCSAPISVLASNMVVEENPDGSAWVIKAIGGGFYAYIKGSNAIWMSGLGKDVQLAKKIIMRILGQSSR